jgi:hypothetical protein
LKRISTVSSSDAGSSGETRTASGSAGLGKRHRQQPARVDAVNKRIPPDATGSDGIQGVEVAGIGDVPWGGVVLDLVRRGGRDGEGHRAMVSETR